MTSAKRHGISFDVRHSQKHCPREVLFSARYHKNYKKKGKERGQPVEN